MAMYAIKDTTLTTLGDAIRNKEGFPFIKEQFNKVYPPGQSNAQILITTIKAPKYRYIIEGEKPGNGDLHYVFRIGVAKTADTIGEELYVFNYDYEYDFPLSFEAEVPYIFIQFYGNNLTLTLNITVIALDENGNEYKYTPLEMAEKINEMNIIPSSGLKVMGNCSYRFSNNGWNWYIDSFGDKIITTDITDLTNMFSNSTTLEEIPFDINAKEQTNVSANYTFNGCNKLKSLPKINNLRPNALTYIFSSCNDLREIPEDWCDTWDWSYLDTLTNTYSGSRSNTFAYCCSLRKFPMSFLAHGNPIITTPSYSIYYYLFHNCYVLDEVVGLPFPHYNGSFTSNLFANAFVNCWRLKNMTFALQEDGTPYVMKWKNQTIELSSYIGYAQVSSNIKNYNSGITADKEVKDDATYQALKNDPDWFSIKLEYSRYNHDSAVATINSLPDCSATGTNTIKFKGSAGALTDGGAINTLTEEEIAVATAKGWTVSLV